MEIEWSGQQQLLFLFKSIPVGALIGLIFSLINANNRKRKFSWRLFITDVFCSVLFALITFFASLVIMDGHLHPVLFGGVAIGFSFVHFLCGRYIAYAVCLFSGVCGATVNGVKRWLIKGLVKRPNEEDSFAENRDSS